MKLFMGMAFTCLMLGLTACQSSGSTVDGKTHQYILKQKCPALLEVDQGEVIVVTLPENPSTGYQWQLAKPVTLLKMEETYLAGKANAGMVGVPGTKTFKFTAEKIGQDDIHLVHIRPWEAKDSSMQGVEQWQCRVRIS